MPRRRQRRRGRRLAAALKARRRARAVPSPWRERHAPRTLSGGMGAALNVEPRARCVSRARRRLARVAAERRARAAAVLARRRAPRPWPRHRVGGSGSAARVLRAGSVSGARPHGGRSTTGSRRRHIRSSREPRRRDRPGGAAGAARAADTGAGGPSAGGSGSLFALTTAVLRRRIEKAGSREGSEAERGSRVGPPPASRPPVAEAMASSFEKKAFAVVVAFSRKWASSERRARRGDLRPSATLGEEETPSKKRRGREGVERPGTSCIGARRRRDTAAPLFVGVAERDVSLEVRRRRARGAPPPSSRPSRRPSARRRLAGVADALRERGAERREPAGSYYLDKNDENKSAAPHHRTHRAPRRARRARRDAPRGRAGDGRGDARSPGLGAGVGGGAARRHAGASRVGRDAPSRRRSARGVAHRRTPRERV